MQRRADIVPRGLGIEKLAQRIQVFRFRPILITLGHPQQPLGFGGNIFVANLDLLHLGQFPHHQRPQQPALGAGPHLITKLGRRFAHKPQVRSHIQALLLEHPLPFRLHRFQLPLVKNCGSVHHRRLAKGIQALLLQLAPRRRAGLAGHRLLNVGAQGGQVVKTLPHRFGKLIVKLRQVLFLHRQHRYLELNLFAGILRTGIIVRNGNRKLQLFILAGADQVGRKPGKWQHIVLMRHILHIPVLQHGLAVHQPVNINVQPVSELRRPLNRLPYAVLLPYPFQHPVNFFVGNADRVGFHADGTIVAQVNRRLQRHSRLEGHRRQVGNFNAGLGKSGYLFILEDFVQGFRHHKLQRFLHQRGAPDHALHDMARRPATPETGDVDARNGAPV